MHYTEFRLQEGHVGSLRFEDVPPLHIIAAVTIIRTEPPKNCQGPPLDYIYNRK